MHHFVKEEEVDVSVCEKCGYVRGEKPYQKCPMRLDYRETKIINCPDCGHRHTAGYRHDIQDDTEVTK
jgi:hypothetical protein